jgi:hypothetical protein
MGGQEQEGGKGEKINGERRRRRRKVSSEGDLQESSEGDLQESSEGDLQESSEGDLQVRACLAWRRLDPAVISNFPSFPYPLLLSSLRPFSPSRTFSSSRLNLLKADNRRPRTPCTQAGYTNLRCIPAATL